MVRFTSIRRGVGYNVIDEKIYHSQSNIHGQKIPETYFHNATTISGNDKTHRIWNDFHIYDMVIIHNWLQLWIDIAGVNHSHLHVAHQK